MSPEKLSKALQNFSWETTTPDIMVINNKNAKESQYKNIPIV